MESLGDAGTDVKLARIAAAAAELEPPDAAWVETLVIDHIHIPSSGLVGFVHVGGVLWLRGTPARVLVELDGVPAGLARMFDAPTPMLSPTAGPATRVGRFVHIVDVRHCRPGTTHEVRCRAVDLDGRIVESAPVTIHLPAPAIRHAGARQSILTAAATARAPAALRLLVVAHHLGLGGAQLYLFEILKHLLADPTTSCLIVSPRDGPLRPALELLGGEVHLCAPFPGQDGSRYEAAVVELGLASGDARAQTTGDGRGRATARRGEPRCRRVCTRCRGIAQGADGQSVGASARSAATEARGARTGLEKEGTACSAGCRSFGCAFGDAVAARRGNVHRWRNPIAPLPPQLRGARSKASLRRDPEGRLYRTQELAGAGGIRTRARTRPGKGKILLGDPALLGRFGPPGAHNVLDESGRFDVRASFRAFATDLRQRPSWYLRDMHFRPQHAITLRDHIAYTDVVDLGAIDEFIDRLRLRMRESGLDDPGQLPRMNEGFGLPWAAAYDNVSRDVVLDAYREDFARFGYSTALVSGQTKPTLSERETVLFSAIHNRERWVLAERLERDRDRARIAVLERSLRDGRGG